MTHLVLSLTETNNRGKVKKSIADKFLSRCQRNKFLAHIHLILLYRRLKDYIFCVLCLCYIMEEFLIISIRMSSFFISSGTLGPGDVMGGEVPWVSGVRSQGIKHPAHSSAALLLRCDGKE